MPNRLARESSPYLLQHAANPVDWYPWGKEAMERARREDRPILLSIGYSACHWCHVMERESFEDPAVAALMNQAFVSIKVDREERPDIDQVYMRAVQSMMGQGGWPLTVFLTPEGEPYYGGTYFPPEPRHGLPSFRQVLDAASAAYRDRPEDVRKGAGDLRAGLTKAVSAGGDAGAAPSPALLDDALQGLKRQYDPSNGGFGQAPKFPQPTVLDLLFRQHARTGDPEPLHMAVHTLRRMANGGLRDHLAGGFHRYSVDARWLVPHFEKMLYDNALLARAYLDAYRLTGLEDMREIACSTLDYILDDLRAPQGGFYSARDADSEGQEGTFYVWTRDQVERVLDADTARIFMQAYDVSAHGNFEGRNILHVPHDLSALAKARGIDPAPLHTLLTGARQLLLGERAKREAPFRDEKVLVSWNGLVIRALAEAGAVLGLPDYRDAAVAGADFILSHIRADGRLLHTWTDGEAKIPGFLEDHGALGNALVSLHEATLNPRWFDEIRWCCREVLDRFWDESEGVFHDTPHDGEALFMRPRDPMDNPTPSGSSLAAELLLRAGHLFDEAEYREVADRVLRRDLDTARRFPGGFGRLLAVADRSLAPPVEVAVVGRRGDPATEELIRAALQGYRRNLTVTGREPEDHRTSIPMLESREALGGRATAYVCQAYACQRPVHDAGGLVAQLRAIHPGAPAD